jgi:hypothetical protein
MIAEEITNLDSPGMVTGRMASNRADLTDVELPHTMSEFIRVSRS